MNESIRLIQTKNQHNELIWRIIVNGQEHPVDFIRHDMALSHMGMLRSRGFQEGVRA